MTWYNVLLIVALVLLFGVSAWFVYNLLRKKTIPPVGEEQAPPQEIAITHAAAAVSAIMAEPKRGRHRHRAIDPGRGKRTRRGRKNARIAAWAPNTADKRAAHKALVLTGLQDEEEG